MRIYFQAILKPPEEHVDITNEEFKYIIQQHFTEYSDLEFIDRVLKNGLAYAPYNMKETIVNSLDSFRVKKMTDIVECALEQQ